MENEILLAIERININIMYGCFNNSVQTLYELNKIKSDKEFIDKERQYYKNIIKNLTNVL